MLKRTTGLAMVTGAVMAMGSSAFAGGMDSVKTFYALLSNPGSADLQAEFAAGTTDDWESIGNYSGKNKNKEAFLGQMGGFAKLLPDLNWQVEAMHDAGEFITVRSRATGTPAAPFLGVDGQGRGFDILTIDIHQIEDGKIARSWHVEDWASAMGQLAGQ